MPDVVNARWERRFNWMSSVEGEPAVLDELDRRLAAFYTEAATRFRYEAVLDDARSLQPATEAALLRAILARRPESILEVGCGSARLYRELRAAGYSGVYVGLEIACETIAANRAAHPEAEWVCGPVDSTVLGDRRFDVAFAYFVLEHCTYPAKALRRLADHVRPGGAVLLVFPDFVEMGRLASQALGRASGRARDHLRRGALVDALVAVYDARIRLPRALKRAVRRCGPFPVNLNPRCFLEPDRLEPDVDAVYIASKDEVCAWARRQGLKPSFPAGRQGHFGENALIQIERLQASG